MRNERGLSLRQLEKKADLVTGTVAALEKGRLSAGPMDLVSLSLALRADPADFFKGLAGAGTADTNKTVPVATSEVEAFLRVYFRLSDPQIRKNLFDMVKAMARTQSDR